MAKEVLLYYITDRAAFPGDERNQKLRLLDKIAEAAGHHVDYIQLREKDLCGLDLEILAREAVRILEENSSPNQNLRPRLLINSRTDVAVVTGADGVHLPADEITAEEVRKVWRKSRVRSSPETPLVSVACHSLAHVSQAAVTGANLAIFAPIFEKQKVPRNAEDGLELLRRASLTRIPVLALGGVTLQNADSCLRAGASGVAGIRLFQENDIASVVRALRGSTRRD